MSVASAPATSTRSTCRSSCGTTGGRLAAGPRRHRLGFKRVLFTRLERGSIVSAGGGGHLSDREGRARSRGGATIFEPFILFGQMLPATLPPGPGGLRAAGEPDRAPTKGSCGCAVGTHVLQQPARPRMVADDRSARRPRSTRRADEWDVVPQVQVTLTATAHCVNVGVQMPVNERKGRGRECCSICCGTGSTAVSSTAGEHATPTS